MTSPLLRLAKAIYRGTPSPRLRGFYFDLFLRVSRGRRLVATREGLTFDLDLGEMIDVGLFLGEYEREMAAAIDALCRPGWCVVDVGANIGAHTLRFAGRVGATGQVLAFEPTTFAYQKLQRNLSLNDLPNVKAFRLALSDHDEPNGVIAARSSWRSDGYQPPSPEPVPFARLDAWCAQNAQEHLDLLKVDVDGNEFAVLTGGRDTLESSRPLILIEAALYHYADARRNPFLLLEEMGYGFWDARSRKRFRDAGALEEALRADAVARIDSRNVIASDREVVW